MNAAPEKNPAELVAGKYRLVRMIGQGGMGSVWEGEHISLGTRVAVKFIERELASSAEARERFDKEARAAAKLQSRYVVGVHDHGVMPDGRPFIVMEYLPGETLEERVVSRGRLELAETALIIGQVAKGLAKAHELGIVHRDLKPENIFLTDSPDDDEQIAKVVDFGIAKFTERAPMGMSSSTRTGTLLGTPVYMSPEQARGLREIDLRSDLWALGVVVYRCVVGQLPFDGQAVGDIVVKICTQDPTPPTQVEPSLPPALDDWFARCVAREREDRFGSAKELAAELMVVAGLVTHAEQAFPPTRVASGPGSNGLFVGSTPQLREASSKVDIENAATQMGATTPLASKAKSKSFGVLGVIFAMVGAVVVVGTLAAWRQLGAADRERATGAHELVSDDGRLGMGDSEQPTGDPRLGTAAPAGSSDPLEASSAPAQSAAPPGSDAPSPASQPRTSPSRRDPKLSNPSKPPPASTETIELGY